jgi:hypothetical protein
MKRYGLLLLLASFSILVNGYHYSADDGAIFVPEIVQQVHPSFYPANDVFFHAHGSLSIFPILAGTVARCLGGSVPFSLFLLHFLGTFVVLASGLRLAEYMFCTARAAWGAVCMLSVVLALFVAGTSIPIMDPYFTARTLSTPLTLIALTSVIARRWMLAAATLMLSFAVHPLMAVFATLFILSYTVAGTKLQIPHRIREYASATPAVLPLGLSWGRVQEPYRQTMISRTFFFATRWTTIEWAGVLIPLAMFLWLWRVSFSTTRPVFRKICGAAFLAGCCATFFFLLLSLSPNLESFVRLQPMRAFQPIYIVMFLIVGGFIGEYLLRAHTWRWVALLLVFGAMDVAIDHAAYPASAHIEFPAAASSNAWVQGFDWARRNTPTDALFALSPTYLKAPGEDMHGFRGIAERSALADEVKDSGVVSMFPAVAPEWKRQVNAEAGWDHFSPADFHRLAQQYRVSWVVVELPQSAGLDCRYHNAAIAICHIA